MKKIALIIFVFLLGLYIICRYPSSSLIEAFQDKDYDCPNILVKKGNKIFLKMSNKAEIPGVNPIEFNNLEDYVEFLNWQRSQNIRCPVLYLEHSTNAQGEDVYKMRPDMFNPQGGLNAYTPDQFTHGPGSDQSYSQRSLLIDASRNDPPYNQNLYPGFDPENQYVGLEVPLDKMFHSQEHNVKSDNPMDKNWGGPAYSEASVKSGAYKDDDVSIYVD